jgi:hypothetical protein
MSRRLFEFVCQNGHITERLVDSEVRTLTCLDCSRVAERIVSAPQVKLEGITGAFPGAYDKWERVRAEKLAVERKQKAKHGEPD